MATISNTPRPGYAWDATDNCWYPIGTGPHTHSDYITQSTAINPSTITTKGDLIVGTGAGTFVRQGVGTNGQLLAANSAQADGVEWVNPPASGSLTLLSTTTLSGTAVTVSSISQSYAQLRIYLLDVYGSTSQANMRIQLNSDTGTNYTYKGFNAGGAGGPWGTDGNNYFDYNNGIGGSTSNKQKVSGNIDFYNYTSTGTKIGFTAIAGYDTNQGSSGLMGSLKYVGTSAISSINFAITAGTWSGGTVLIYGVN